MTTLELAADHRSSGHHAAFVGGSQSFTFDTWEEAYACAELITTGPAGDHSRPECHSASVSSAHLGVDQLWPDDHGYTVHATNFASGQHHNSGTAGKPNPDMIAYYGGILDLWEGFRKAINNQVGAYTRYHGVGVDDPNILAAIEFYDSIKRHEDGIAKVLERSVALHPIAPWIKATPGIGYKAVGRVLATVGDPSWNDMLDRPRTRAELREYCGWGDPGQRRQKGRRSNWNPRARTAVWNIAPPMIKNGGVWRPIYDEARERYANAIHADPCAQCGPKGNPAPEGSPLSKGHQHARGIRSVCKKFLDELHAEAVRLRELGDATT